MARVNQAGDGKGCSDFAALRFNDPWQHYL